MSLVRIVQSFRLLLPTLLILISMMGQRPALAQSQYCGLALVLAMDASSSVDDREYGIQMRGMAAALLDTEVREAIDLIGGLYLAAFEWNGKLKQKLIFDWVFLETGSDTTALAGILGRHVRNTKRSPTALGAALGYAHRLFPRLPSRCTRQVIDVSGDGHNNDGVTPDEIYALYDFSNIQVNGLVIKDLYTSPETFYRDPETNHPLLRTRRASTVQLSFPPE